jgi:hypothetical protein
VGGDWIRIELKARHEAAMVIGEAMVLYGVERAGRSAIVNFCKSDVDWYRKATEGDLCEIAPMRYNAGDSYHWLLAQCLPALKREVEAEIAQGRYHLYDAFIEVLQNAFHSGNKRDLEL